MIVCIINVLACHVSATGVRAILITAFGRALANAAVQSKLLLRLGMGLLAQEEAETRCLLLHFT